MILLIHVSVAVRVWFDLEGETDEDGPGPWRLQGVAISQRMG
jgi:hypothetical protein